MPGIDKQVGEGDTFKFGSFEVRVLDTPGHTAGHITYLIPSAGVAFVGDTLFAIGCGRVIEGNAQMMWNSLQKLMALPKETQRLLRTRVHAVECEVRAHDRAGECGARRSAPRRSTSCARRENRRCRPISASSSRPTRSCARSVPAIQQRLGHGRQARVADLRRDPRAQEPGLRRVVRALAGDSQQWPRPAPCRPTSPSTIS